SMLRFLTRTNIDFMAIRYYFFAATILLTVLGASIFFWRLDKGGLNIDFVGGTAYTGRLTKPVSIGDLRVAADEEGQKELVQAAITQLLADVPRTAHANDPARLKRIGLKTEPGDNPFRISADNRSATLEFIDLESGQPDYASPAQARLLLDRELRALDLA